MPQNFDTEIRETFGNRYLKVFIRDINRIEESQRLLQGLPSVRTVNVTPSQSANNPSQTLTIYPTRVYSIEETQREVISTLNNYFNGVIDRTPPVQNEAHFRDIQNRIIAALDSARVSIKVAMAWFTNEELFNKLVEKQEQGVDVQLVIYDDGVNRRHGFDFSRLNHTPIRRAERGGLMHDKFCVIDNQTVITGSYNWTNNAEFRNEENITIERDPQQASTYSVEFRRLMNSNTN